MIESIPREIVSIVGLSVIGFIGNTLIMELGNGKVISVAFNLILFGAAAAIGLKFVWDKINDIAAVFGISI